MPTSRPVTVATTTSPYGQRPYASDSFTYSPDPYGRYTTPPPIAITTQRPELGFLEVRIDLQRSRFPLNDQVRMLMH